VSHISAPAPRRLVLALALALAGLAAPAPGAAGELGRLFFTPEQRQDLDRRRVTNRAEEETPQIKEGPLTLDGHVQRSSGKTATWLNGVPQYDGGAGGDPAQVTVVPNVGERGIDLKVGQVYERASGSVHDRLDGGTIEVGRPAAKRPPAAARGGSAQLPTPSR